MVEFVSYEKAKEVSRREPVVFAEIVAEHDGTSSLEVHVAIPEAESLYEIERDDTGPIPDSRLRDYVEEIAMAHGVRFAAIYPVRDHWPPRFPKPD